MRFLTDYFRKRKNRKLLEQQDVSVEIYSLLAFIESFEFQLRNYMNRSYVKTLDMSSKDRAHIWDIYQKISDVGNACILKAIEDTARVKEKK